MNMNDVFHIVLCISIGRLVVAFFSPLAKALWDKHVKKSK